MKFKSENVLSSTIVHALHHTSGVKVTIPNLSNLTIDQFQKILLTHGMLTLLKREAEEGNWLLIVQEDSNFSTYPSVPDMFQVRKIEMLLAKEEGKDTAFLERGS